MSLLGCPLLLVFVLPLLGGRVLMSRLILLEN